VATALLEESPPAGPHPAPPGSLQGQKPPPAAATQALSQLAPSRAHPAAAPSAALHAHPVTAARAVPVAAAPVAGHVMRSSAVSPCLPLPAGPPHTGPSPAGSNLIGAAPQQLAAQLPAHATAISPAYAAGSLQTGPGSREDPAAHGMKLAGSYAPASGPVLPATGSPAALSGSFMQSVAALRPELPYAGGQAANSKFAASMPGSTLSEWQRDGSNLERPLPSPEVSAVAGSMAQQQRELVREQPSLPNR
jgi:hypothetical protein